MNGRKSKTNSNTLSAEVASPADITGGPVIQVSCNDDLPEIICNLLLARGQPPDLDNQVILTPRSLNTSGIRQQILELAARRGFPALLGPRIMPLSQWLNDTVVLTEEILHPAHRQLQLIQALKQHPSLCGQGGAWQMAQSLIPLFDELSREQLDLPEDPEQFESVLRNGYQLHNPVPDGFSHEARIVHTLWQAWQKQQAEDGLLDGAAAYTRQLARSLDCIPETHHLYLVGFHHLAGAELAWLSALLHRASATLIVQGLLSEKLEQFVTASQAKLTATHTRTFPASGSHTTDDEHSTLTSFLDCVFANMTGCTITDDLSARMRRFSGPDKDSPIAQHVKMTTAADGEQHAAVIELQLRLWLAQGLRRIGIVCEDRRLSRRLRALLERQGLSLRDQAGWALSTTSAATALERLLQSVEEDFDQLALLDLLKSPFLLPDWPREERMQAVFWLERDIVRHENIHRGLSRYRRHVRFRQKRLAWRDGNHHGQVILDLLDVIEQASRPLRNCLHRKHSTPSRLLDALLQGLAGLGIEQSYRQDPAGIALLDTLLQIRSATSDCDIGLGWNEFRLWLGNILEQATFRPASGQQPVALMTLEQTGLQHFDGLIIAGLDSHQMPGPAPVTPFFNDRVRLELGLGTRQRHQRLRLSHFMGLLHHAEHVLLTWQRHQDSQEMAPSPWLALLDTGHRLAYGRSLEDTLLATWSQCLHASRAATESSLPAPASMPAPAIPPDLLPEHYSASSYQRLVDCPYLFYATDCLGLKPPESIQEALEKSDYGERVHRILQAFHEKTDDLPGPFDQPLTADNRQSAHACLEDISRAVFATDLEDNVLHRGWLQRWLGQIPAYLDWQIERQQRWQVSQLEQQLTATLAGTTIRLKGRLDRIDRNEEGCAVIDYKTGAAPGQQEVENGEAVQLPFYALLHDRVCRTEYLVLDNNRPRAALLENDSLTALVSANADRLRTTDDEIRRGRSLPAWGDDRTCSYCHMSGICRRGLWTES